MSRIGRVTKLTSATHAAIVNAVAAGVPLPAAASLAGIDPVTAHEWVRRGEGRDPRPTTPLYAAFAGAIRKAQSQDEARRLLRITDVAKGGQITYTKTTTYPDGRTVQEVQRTRPEWTADAWVLERSRPETWGRKGQVDLHVTIERVAQKVAGELGLTVEEVLAEAEHLLKDL